MVSKIRLWQVEDGQQPTEISSAKIAYEEHLEDWLEADISMLDTGLLVIGRQVRTEFGGEIDLLCLDAGGNVVVVELKKGQTPRDVTAQALDYASWVSDLTPEKVKDIANRYFEKRSRTLGDEPVTLEEMLPEYYPDESGYELNTSHRILIVAEAMDDQTERIVKYLSDMSVPINVATVQHFESSSGQQLLARVFLVEPEEAARKRATNSQPPLLRQEQEAMADDRGVRRLYDVFRKERPKSLQHVANARRGFAYRVQKADAAWVQAVKFQLDESASDQGIRFELRSSVFMNEFGMTPETITDMLPESTEVRQSGHWTHAGYFATDREITNFTEAVKKAGA